MSLYVRRRAHRRPGAGPFFFLAAVLLTASAMGGPALAGEPWEGWPEASAFIGLNEQTRLYFDAAHARGKESNSRALDVSGFVDVSIKPILRPDLRQEDWARKRYLWTRIGYTRVSKGEQGTRAPSEDRGSVALYGRVGLPAEFWLESRARTDFRWIDGDYSTRYRLRFEATREFSLVDRPVTPYLNAEGFYDSRYEDWARVLYMLGSEVTLSRGFRFELYLARQVDDHPSEFALNALGVVAKWYF